MLGRVAASRQIVMDFIKHIKQLLCKYIWVDDYITYKTLWPYIIPWKKVKRCIKCGRIE